MLSRGVLVAYPIAFHSALLHRFLLHRLVAYPIAFHSALLHPQFFYFYSRREKTAWLEHM